MMSLKNELSISGHRFEGLKQVNEHGAEYWSARTLQPLLGYSQWRRFEQAIERASTSCKESGNPPENHFAAAGKMVALGSGSEREIDDYQLSRFACYLIAQNGDPRKPEIALAQQYFAIQTRRQEIGDQAAVDQDYISLTDAVRTFDGGGALIEQWLKNKDTVLIIGVCEQINHAVFNFLEFEGSNYLMRPQIINYQSAPYCQRRFSKI